MDYYNILGVSKNASQDEITKAYRKLAMRHHPDRGGDAQEFQKISQAYDILGNEQKRKQYDNPQPQFNHQGRNPFEFGFGPNADHIRDIFEQFGHAHRRRQANPDVVCDITISLNEAYTGVEKIIRTEFRTVRVNIPAGVRTGHKFVLQGQGPEHIPNMPLGDLVVRITVHPTAGDFELRENNLYKILNIDYFSAILGCKVDFDHLDSSKIRLSVPSNLDSGAKIRLRGKGMPLINGGTGDLFIIVNPVCPKLTEQQKEKLKELVNREIEYDTD